MKISARNQFEGTISNVVEGSVNGVVTIDFEGYAIKADITMESVKGLELAEGVVGEERALQLVKIVERIEIGNIVIFTCIRY